MLRFFGHYINIAILFLGVLEFLGLSSSMYAALYVRQTLLLDITEIDHYWLELILFAITFNLVLFSLGAYEPEALQDLRAGFIRVCVGFVVGFVVLSAILYALPSLQIWRSVLLIAVIIGFVSLLLIRFAYIRLMRLDDVKRRVLVLGSGAWAANVARLGRSNTLGSFVCFPYLPSAPERSGTADRGGSTPPGAKLLEFVRRHRINEIVVPQPYRQGELPVEALLKAKLSGVKVTDYVSFWERETGRVDLDHVSANWLVFADGFASGSMRRAVKRAIDVIASLAFLTVTLPLMLAAAVAIRLESRGPVFYVQERVGYRNRPFKVIKFRSMRTDAEKDGVPQWAQTNDPRVTRVGAFIRKTRIDEIPQIFNVLKGDMSFVGPRPERPFFVEELAEAVPFYKERHWVKPGITGWAQLNYPYGASVADAKAKLEYDLYYLKNYSVFFDFVIMLQTARVVFFQQGAR